MSEPPSTSASALVSPLPLSPPRLPQSTCETATSEAPPSLYVTFKVLRLVNAFRQRVKTHARSCTSKQTTSPRVKQGISQVFERQAFEAVDFYLGRKKVRSSLRRRSALPLKGPGDIDHNGKHLNGKKRVERLIHQIDKSIRSRTSLNAVAKNQKLFLRRDAAFNIKPLPLKALAQVFGSVQDLLSTLRRSTACRSRVKTVAEGDELLDISLDETYIANLEHVLLCLRDQLLRRLVDKLVGYAQKHLIDCQKNRGKHGDDDWFSEFPDSRHPLSTTWPWSIKPSLAVMWGVCWMFYDSMTDGMDARVQAVGTHFDRYGNWVDAQGTIVVPAEDVRQGMYGTGIQPERYDTMSFNFSGSSVSNAPAAIWSSSSNRRGLNPEIPEHSHRRQERTPPTRRRLDPASTSVRPVSASANNLLPLVGAASPAPGPGSNTRCSSKPRSSANPDPATSSSHALVNNFLPQDYNTSLPQQHQHDLATFPSTSANASYSAFAADPSAWPYAQQRAVLDFDTRPALPPAATTRPRHHSSSPNPTTPSIRVTTDFSGLTGFPSTPQDHQYHSHSASSASSLHHPYLANPYNSANLSPHNLSPSDPRSMNPDPVRQDMNTPVSPPHSPHDGTYAQHPPLTRKRSISQMSNDGGVQLGTHHQSRAPSITHSTHSPNEGYSPRGSRAFKRPDPPVNGAGKYYCNLPECQDQTFDRKCEWSKHMDKHDRPYQCPHPSCAKLQGFTYSGGLLRHEREVHGKHGGPKAQLMCPFQDCKRHTGKGFTRKENLNEHVRRVHEGKTQGLQQNHLKLDAPELGLDASEINDTPASETLGLDEFNGPPPAKRQRSDVPIEDVESMRMELQHLRAENAAKDERLQIMEAADAARSEEIRRLEDMMRQMQQMQQQMQMQDGQHAIQN